MSKFWLYIILETIIFYLVRIKGSKNGELWTCDSDILWYEILCVFVRTDGIASGPHNMNRSVGKDGYRVV